MTLASRAFGPQSRGIVLGFIGATVGIGGAIGPLVGGALANIWAWEAVFGFTALAAVAIPFALRILPRDEEIAGGHLDIIGGVLLAIAIVGILVAPTEAAKSGWGSTCALGGIGIAVVALLAMVRHQRSASEPFIPNEFVQNRRFNALVSMSFLVMATNMAPLIGLPIMLALVNGLSAIEIGIVLLPGAILTALTGVLSGTLVDSVGTKILAKLGGMLMLAAIVGFSGFAGDSEWKISVFAGLMGAGFGLINTPLATAVTRVVEPRLLGSALGVNSMLFFIGGSLGTAILLGFSTSDASSSVNPLHDGVANGFSDGFLFLTVPIIAVLLLTSKLPGRAPATEQQPESRAIHEWRGDCSVGWSPDIELDSPASSQSS